MKILLKLFAVIGISLSSSVFAVEFGQYEHVNTRDAYLGQVFFGFQEFIGIERGRNKTTYICIDDTSRRVPGKVIDGRCWVEWNGKGYANTDFKILTTPASRWESISGGNRDEVKALILDKGITNGIIERGEYVFHCRVTVIGNEVVFGKYIPADNGCYYEYYGAKFRGDTDGDSFIEVLLSSGSTPPPWSPGDPGVGDPNL